MRRLNLFDDFMKDLDTRSDPCGGARALPLWPADNGLGIGANTAMFSVVNAVLCGLWRIGIRIALLTLSGSRTSDAVAGARGLHDQLAPSRPGLPGLA